MRFVLDENVPREVGVALRSADQTVIAVADLVPRALDEEVLELSAQQRAVLVTQDKDFGELVYRTGRSSYGVLLLRLAGFTSQAKAEFTLKAISDHGPDLVGSFAVLTPNQLRIRRSPAR